MNEQLSERGKDLVKYMPQAVNALADRLIEKLGERLFYGEKPQTNADRIRAMTDEELAEWLASFVHCDCPVVHYRGCGSEECDVPWLDWLKQEAN